jgi:RNA polymerase sigma-70 factor, ECF subfamily
VVDVTGAMGRDVRTMSVISTSVPRRPEPRREPGPWLRLEQHRRELTGHCRRVLGSASEAEDAVQETMVRAWRGYERFEGRASLRSWLHRIATNVCVDMIRMPQRRMQPMDLGPDSAHHAVLDGAPGAGPRACARRSSGGHTVPVADDPAERVAVTEAVQQAFVTALQHLPARQRAVLILREVLHWKAGEVADLLATSVPAVNSALQRARATLSTLPDTGTSRDDVTVPLEEPQAQLLADYVDAFGRTDVESLVSLLHADAAGTHGSASPPDLLTR